MKSIDSISEISPNLLKTLGLEDTAYVRSVTVDGREIFGIHSADGTPLTCVDTRELAFATIKQHDMNPVSVH